RGVPGVALLGARTPTILRSLRNLSLRALALGMCGASLALGLLVGIHDDIEQTDTARDGLTPRLANLLVVDGNRVSLDQLEQQDAIVLGGPVHSACVNQSKRKGRPKTYGMLGRSCR